jgi:HEAT repeat protein
LNEDTNASVRAEAASGVGKIGSKKAIIALTKAINTDPCIAVKLNAVQALLLMKENGTDVRAAIYQIAQGKDRENWKHERIL